MSLSPSMKPGSQKRLASTRMTKDQRTWCKNYQRETGFEALMDDFLEGNESFVAGAKNSVRWFEDWSSDTMHRIDVIPGAEE